MLAAVPQQINYQGYLTDTGGNPLDTTVAMTFKLHTDSLVGSLLWTETRPSVTVADGLFNVRLGQVTALGDNIFNNAQIWLGITVGDNSEMTPRSRIVSVGYSYRVGTVDGASGGTITGDVNIVGKGNIGSGNSNPGLYAFTVGYNGSAAGDYSTVSGGRNGRATAYVTSVNGGSNNEATEEGATVGGGGFNKARAIYSVIAGGGGINADSNHIAPIGNYSFIGGGHHNYNYGNSSVIAGGASNQAYDNYSVVGGGHYNRARGDYSVVSGGGGPSLSDSNCASGFYSTISGGGHNTSGGTYTVVGGG
jgi:hypothetical protein